MSIIWPRMLPSSGNPGPTKTTLRENPCQSTIGFLDHSSRAMNANTAQRLRVGEWLVDPATNQIARGAERVHLEPKVVDLLLALAGRADQVVSREELLAQVWSGVIVGDDVLTQGVIKLRKALGDASGESRYIQTIPKRGYRLIAAVSRP